MRKNIWLLAFRVWLTSLKMMFSSSIHLPEDDKISFFFIPYFKIYWSHSNKNSMVLAQKQMKTSGTE
jgi:hypothetical protein